MKKSSSIFISFILWIVLLHSRAGGQCNYELATFVLTGTNTASTGFYQTFTATSGMLSVFNFYASFNGKTLTYTVYQGEGTGGTQLYTTTITHPTIGFGFRTDGVTFPFQSNLYLSSGSIYTIAVTSGSTFNYLLNPNNPYSGGKHNGNNLEDVWFSIKMSDPPSLSLSSFAIAFNSRLVGSFVVDSVIATNAGCSALTISSVSVTNGQFSVTPTSATIDAGSTRTFFITYNPTTTTSINDTITFVSNSPAHGNKKISLSGTGVFQSQANAEKALTFDGTDDYVVLSNYANLKLTTGTVEAWIKTSASNSAIFSKANEYSLMINGGNLGIYNWGPISANQGYRLSTTNVADGEWHHVAMSFQSGVTNGTILYVDGAQVYTTTLTRNATEGDNIFAAVIGNVYSNTLNLQFSGSIDEVRLWNTVRTKEQIRENMHLSLSGNESGLYGYWRLDETSGTSAGDGTGHSYSGAYQSLPAQTISEIPLGSGSSKHYSGVMTGNLDFPTFETRWLRISMYDDPFDNAVDIVCTQLNGSSNQLPVGSSTLLDRYWIVRVFGTPGTFSAHIMPIVSPAFTDTSMADPSSYTLYRRAANSTSAWSSVGTPALTFWNGGEGLDFYGVSMFGQFSVGTNDPLPVELVSFTATLKHLNIELKWSTASEVNNYGFEVQRSVVSNQSSVNNQQLTANGWSQVGFIEGNGTTNAPKKYSIMDKNLSPGKYSYRLKQIDRDGKFSYSKEVEVTGGHVPKMFTLEQNYPNPFNPTTVINYQLPVNSMAILKVYDAIGREVSTLVNEVKEAGSYSVQFDGTKLSSGIYFAKLVFGGRSQLKKLVLMK